MKKLIIIILSLVSIAQAQVRYTPEEMSVLNRFAPPLRDTIGPALKVGEIRTRPQDKAPYWWNGTNWYTFPLVGGGGSYTFNSPLSESGGAVSISDASSVASGIVSTGTQSFAGLKTFTSGVSQTNAGTASGYYQLTNSGGNFQFGLAGTGYPGYGLAQPNTAYLYTSAQNGVGFISDAVTSPGSFRFAFNTGTPMLEVASGFVRVGNTWNLPITAGTDGYVLTSNGTGGSVWAPGGGGGGSSQWTTLTTNTIGYTGADNHSGASVLSPSTGKAAYLRAASFDGVDTRIQSNGADAYIGVVSAHPLSILSGNVSRLEFPLAAAPIFTDFVGVGDRYAGFDATGHLKIMPTPSGGGSQSLDQVLTIGNVSDLTIGLTGYQETGPHFSANTLHLQDYSVENQIIGFQAYYSAGWLRSTTGVPSFLNAGSGSLAYYNGPTGSGAATFTPVERFRVNADGSIKINNTYTLPSGIGSAGQALRVPASGSILEWFTPGSGGGSSNWTVSGSDIYRNSKVGIGSGATIPAQLLDIHQDQNAYTGLQVQNASTGAAATASGNFISSGATLQFGTTSSGYSAYGLLSASKGYLYSDQTLQVALDNNSARFSVAIGSGISNERFGINASGAVTINNAFTFPTTASPVNGYVLYGNTDGSMGWVANGSGGGMTNPMTTAGDLIVGGSAGTPARLGIGANGTYLRSNGSSASWSGFTADVRTQLSAGTGISYNSSTGVISASGGGAGQDGTYATASGISSGTTPLTLTGVMPVSSGEAGEVEITVYAINSTSNSSYSHKVIIPYLATSSTTITFGSEQTLLAPEVLGSALSAIDGIDTWDYGVDVNGDIIIGVTGVSGQTIQWRVEIKKYSVVWSS